MESKTYYRSIRKRIEQEKQFNGYKDQKGEQTPPKGLYEDEDVSKSKFDLQTIYMPKLPTHLRKNLFETFDLRFIIILGISFLFHVLFLSILYHNTSFEVTSDDISKLQKNYANLILDEHEITEDDEKIDDGTVRADGPPKEIEPPESDVVSEEEPEEQIAKTRTEHARRAKSGTGEPSQGLDVEDAGETGNRGAVVAKVSSMGVLEYMKSTVITSDVDNDFLVYTDAINNNFMRTLDGIDAEDLIAATKLGDSNDGLENSPNRFRNPLHMKRSRGNVEIKDLFGRETPLEAAKTIPIDKIAQYEKIPTSPDAISRRRKRRVQRIPSEISKVIQLHNKAIQDCYKQALRRDVSVKGKIVVQFTINSQGRVTSASIFSSTISNERMERCVVNKVRRWNDFGICEEQAEDISLKQSYVFGY